MAGVQPATRRLLTESTGVLAATRGMASGVATLGTDGKLPAAQLPAGISPAAAAQLAAAATSSVTTAADTTAAVTLQPGTYLVSLTVTGNGGAAAIRPGLRMATGAATGTLVGPCYGSALATGSLAVGSQLSVPTGSVAAAHVVGLVTVTTAGALTLTVASSAAGTSVTLNTGSTLSALRIS